MENQKYLEICRDLIEKKINRGSYKNWTNGDYEKLSELISEEVKEYISSSSLKRLFGKVNYVSEPSLSTLNILAKYVGYKDWYDLINKFAFDNDKSISVKSTKLRRSQTTIFILLSLLILFIGAFVLFRFKKDPTIDLNIKYKMVKKTAPSNVVFEYNISKISEDSITIDFKDHFASNGRSNIKKLIKDHHTITHTYLVSGIYHPVIFLNNKPVDTLTVCIYSDGWEYIIARYFPTSKEFFPVSSNSVIRKNGLLSIPATEIYKYTKDTVSDYWVKYRYFKNFNVNSDSMKFKVRSKVTSSFKNNCNEIDIWILGTSDNIIFKVFNPGCGGAYSKVQLGAKVLDGDYTDLSAFGHSLSQWRDISLDVVNKKAVINIDGKAIYEGMIEGGLGKLTGFVLHTKGSAEFDYVSLEADGKVLLRDDF